MGPGTRSALRELRKWLPAPMPVKVRTRRRVLGGPGEILKGFAQALQGPGGCVVGFDVVIDGSMPDWCQKEALVHEWAHCLSWPHEENVADDHSPEWGVAYARCYRLVYQGSHEFG